MASENETIADIVAQIRAAAYIQNADPPKSVLRLANRIEAAWKRERVEVATTAAGQAVNLTNEKYRNTPVGNAEAHAMTLDEAIAHAEDVADRCDTSCGREHRQLADWLKELRDIRQRPVGNAAAMREALVSCMDYLQRIDHPMNDYMRGLFETAYNKTTAALSVPPRQCDIGTAEDQARRFYAYYSIHNPPSYAACLAWAQMPYFETEGVTHGCE